MAKDNSEKKTSLLKMDVKDLKNLGKNKESGVLSGKGKDSLPSKDTMNLFVKVRTDNSPERVVPVAIILLILILIFCKFAVFDRLAKLNEAEAQLASSQNLYEQYQKELIDYSDVEERYYRYTDEYKTEEEASLVDRARIIDIMDDAVASYGTMQSFSVSENEVQATVYASNLDRISKIRKRLESYSKVENVSVYTATKSSGDETYVSASFVFDVVKSSTDSNDGGEEDDE